MSRSNPGMRPCVASSSCSRIDLVPSARAAVLAVAWLSLLCAVILGGVALPLAGRIAICVSIATPGWLAIRGCVLLRGGGAVRALAWEGGWRAWIGPGRIETSVTLQAGSFRVGRLFVLLGLRSRDGMHGIFIDAGRQEPRSFRRLCRQLRWPVSPS